VTSTPLRWCPPVRKLIPWASRAGLPD